MLTRGPAWRLVLTVTLLLAPAAVGAVPAQASCPPATGMAVGDAGTVTTCAQTPGSAGGSASSTAGSPSNGTQLCRRQGGGEIPCTVNGAWWSSTRQCYVVKADPQPPADSPFWTGRESGAAYRCTSGGQLVDGALGLTSVFWLPAGSAPGPDPAVLAQQAVDTMHLKAVTVGLTPPPGSSNPTLVGIPTWMWVDQPTGTTFGPATATASAGGVTVTATAKVSGVTWDMGDGTRIECGKGTPYSPGYGGQPSPDCGHTYRKAGDYTVTATSHWVVDWTGAGQSGRITLDLTSRTGTTVAQAYSVVTGQA